MSEPRTLGSLLGELTGARLVRGDPATGLTAVEHDSRAAAPGPRGT